VKNLEPHLDWDVLFFAPPRAGRIIAALSLDVFEKTGQAYADRGGEWINDVAANQG
jgi:hypothetical protein